MNDKIEVSSPSSEDNKTSEITRTSVLSLDVDISEVLSESEVYYQNLDINHITKKLEEIACYFLSTPSSVAIRVVDCEESQALNCQFRGKDKPTNVLSFPSELPDIVESDFIGDIAICLPVVIQEAEQQQKTISAHFTHMCLHGVLHLLGYDHIEETDANEMETIEIEILARLCIDDPYQIQ